MYASGVHSSLHYFVGYYKVKADEIQRTSSRFQYTVTHTYINMYTDTDRAIFQ